eukprot:GHVQ01040105.1.p1 GENE.GHVQ01040105.1~~GHVQ01040105.1.p1  ORF type:complete len:688 (+),score=77.90 GHVQ01040105.1:338-2401(+)
MLACPLSYSSSSIKRMNYLPSSQVFRSCLVLLLVVFVFRLSIPLEGISSPYSCSHEASSNRLAVGSHQLGYEHRVGLDYTTSGLACALWLADSLFGVFTWKSLSFSTSLPLHVSGLTLDNVPLPDQPLLYENSIEYKLSVGPGPLHHPLNINIQPNNFVDSSSMSGIAIQNQMDDSESLSRALTNSNIDHFHQQHSHPYALESNDDTQGDTEKVHEEEEGWRGEEADESAGSEKPYEHSRAVYPHMHFVPPDLMTTMLMTTNHDDLCMKSSEPCVVKDRWIAEHGHVHVLERPVGGPVWLKNRIVWNERGRDQRDNEVPMDVVWHRNADEGCGDCIGVVLVNLGSPKKPTYRYLWGYLRQFLSDRRVIDMHPLLWRPILHGAVLPFRSGASAKKYKNVWTKQGSPLVATTESQKKKLQTIMIQRYGYCGSDPSRTIPASSSNDKAPVTTASESGMTGNLSRSNTPKELRVKSKVIVKMGMRYGEPSVGAALRELHDEGVRKILVLPLYPQPAEASTASVYDAVFSEIKSWRYMPDLRILGGYADNPSYVRAVSKSVQEFWTKNGKGQKLIISYHGLPAKTLLKGDPYFCYCSKTARLIGANLGLQAGEDYEVAFQSRFGSAEWLKPYLSDRLPILAAAGIRTLDVVSPGFSTDCLVRITDVYISCRHLVYISGVMDGPTVVSWSNMS